MNLTSQQLKQLEEKGISQHVLEKQIQRFITGFPDVNLDRAATINDGIQQIEKDKQRLIKRYENHQDDLKIIKFIPASGAATRMFKFLHEFLNNYDPLVDSINSYINKNKAKDLFTFFIALEKFPFYNQVINHLKNSHKDWLSLSDRYKKLFFVKHMLEKDGLNYGYMPKGLVPFHKYKDHNATAFEEHLFEASVYAQSKGNALLHFTIAPAFKNHFTHEFNRIEQIVEEKTGTSFDISFSHQLSSTDTIAVDKNSEPIITEDGSLFFRPSGHGALLNNLNQLDADILFIKNVDNVTVSSLEKEIGAYKKMLAGYLLEIQETIFSYLNKIDDEEISNELQKEIETFLITQLCTVLPNGYHKYAKQYQLEYLHNRLNRPLRVCGMVKNEGEPGGGPFWVHNQKGELSIEIVESSQVDQKDDKQIKIAQSGTHFNPVDLVCGIKNYKGEKFNLLDYSDEDTGFITNKSRLGKSIKAQELPGLWNGGMAYWNSVFVEVPLITFNPVKTVNDLLKPAHQN